MTNAVSEGSSNLNENYNPKHQSNGKHSVPRSDCSERTDINPKGTRLSLYFADTINSLKNSILVCETQGQLKNVSAQSSTC